MNELEDNVDDVSKTITKMRRKLVFLVVWVFMCGVGACAGFQAFVQDLYGLDGYIAYLRNHWSDLPPAVSAAAMAMNILIAVWAYFQVQDYIGMRERLVLIMAKAVEMLHIQRKREGT